MSLPTPPLSGNAAALMSTLVVIYTVLTYMKPWDRGPECSTFGIHRFASWPINYSAKVTIQLGAIIMWCSDDQLRLSISFGRKSCEEQMPARYFWGWRSTETVRLVQREKTKTAVEI